MKPTSLQQHRGELSLRFLRGTLDGYPVMSLEMVGAWD